MSDPSRWLDPAGDAPQGARHLLNHAPKVPALSADARARMATRVAQASVAGAAGGVVATSLWKGLFGASAIGLASIALVFAMRARDTAPRAVAPPHFSASSVAAPPLLPDREPAVVPIVDHPVVAASVVVPVAAAPVERSARAVTHAPVAANAPDELVLLQRADGLVSSDPAGALALAREHASHFPHGRYVQERERIAIRALARAGRTQEVLARGDAFLRRYPDSIYATPVRDLLRTLR